ncbi:UDP-N-acetylmuramoyl-L-alanine--D-glutamate ligase [Candidatus Latescibacterota bacterium]
MRTDIDTFKNKRVTVMGLGSFGGGIGAARFLTGCGAQVTVTDMKSEHDLRESVKALDGYGVRFVLGRHDMSDFTETDLVVASPAVPRESDYIVAARSADVNLTTEVGLFVERCPATICGITGSNGKTTTVSMIRSILECSGDPFHVGGNIGGSLLSSLDSIGPDDHVVLELSSFQLEWLDDMGWSPRIAVILNIMPNHLDRHGTFERYRESKMAILKHQGQDDIALLVSDDPGSSSLRDMVQGTTIWVGTDHRYDGITVDNGMIGERRGAVTAPICNVDCLLVPGKHNILNAMSAVACTREMGIGHDDVCRGLATFAGVPHRLEYIGEYNGIRYYNDSKATTPEAAVAAISSFGCPVIPILGGYDKNVSFENAAREMHGKVKWTALIGETSQAIAEQLDRVGIESIRFRSLDEAFSASIDHAEAGDVIVLTPGCASYDMFPNYEVRGNIFRDMVKRYVG